MIKLGWNLQWSDRGGASSYSWIEPRHLYSQIVNGAHILNKNIHGVKKVHTQYLKASFTVFFTCKDSCLPENKQLEDIYKNVLKKNTCKLPHFTIMTSHFQIIPRFAASHHVPPDFREVFHGGVPNRTCFSRGSGQIWSWFQC